MWWKIYFWLSVGITIVGLLGLISLPETITPITIFEFVVLFFALTGLYSYVYAKKLLSTIFWKGLFWFNIFYEVLYFVQVFIPHAAVQEYLTFLSSYEEISPEFLIIGLLFEIPLLIAIYKLMHGEYYAESTSKPNLVANKTAPKWGMFQTALWGYNTVFTGIIFLLSFAASGDTGQSSTDQLSGLAIFAPLMVFWLLVLVKYKLYRWNWWRTTLVANSLLYSGIILYGIVAGIESEPSVSSSGVDIIGILQVLILFVSLIVFGRDQFSVVKKASPPRKKSESL